MKESTIRTALTVAGVVVGIIGGSLSAYVTMVGRVERRVEMQTEQRVNQAVLQENAKTQEQRWWMQQAELDGLENEIDALRVEMARSHQP